MTAEIAILNRSAIALAADSAVTISVGGKSKTYDTAEKLFELTRDQPIALMIYNNVEFVGVPLDVLIRKFRAAEAPTKYATMKEAADKFISYLADFDHEVFEEEKYLYLVMQEHFKRIYRNTNIRMRSLLTELMHRALKNEALPEETPQSVLISLILKAVDVERARALPDYLSNVTYAAFKRRFGSVIQQACKDIFKSIEIDAAVLQAACRLGFRLMKSRRPSEFVTGLIFGGFAEKDMFPTVRYIEIDGVYFGKIKVISTKEVDIDRRKTRAEVVPFAQKEMVERFMYGLDIELETDIRKFVGTALNEMLVATVPENFAAMESLKKKINGRFGNMMDKLKEDSRQDLLDIVYFMSKKELAEIAYALVELTSQKRRFSTEEQTVGGPIDVAILTKSEGLVWIRRKHYFGPETNQGYYSRVFGRISGGNNEGTEAGEPAQ